MRRTVGDIMTTRLITFAPDTGIQEATRVLLDARISGAPVVDGSGTLVGVLSKKDCLKIALSSTYHGDPGGSVREFMSSPADTLDAGVDLVSAAQHFVHSHYRRFPVLRDGRLVGQVSRCDVLRALIDTPR